MKSFLIIMLSCLGLFANSELNFIEDSYKEASKNFTVQKNEHNITKLLLITKVLYENNKKLKELKAKYTKKLTVELTSKKELDKLQVDDVVELHVKTSHNVNEEYTRADLSFFIYDGDKLLVEKNVELYEKGGVHKESLKFTITEPSDKYKICATFKEDGKEYKACESFGVVQLVVTKPIIASTSLGATSSDKQLFPNREFFLYMPFENKSDIPLEGKIEITDNGNVILSEDLKKEPAVGFKKAGVLVPASLLHEKQSLHVKIFLKGEGINLVEKTEDVYISAFEWSLSFPSSLDKNEAKNFEIVAPKSFVKPLHVDVSPHGGVVIAHNSSNLKGSIVGASRIKETANVRVTIKDAKGEKVQRSIAIALNPNLVVAKKPPVVYTPKALKKYVPKKTPKAIKKYKPKVAPKPVKKEVKKPYEFYSWHSDYYLKFKHQGVRHEFVFNSSKMLMHVFKNGGGSFSGGSSDRFYMQNNSGGIYNLHFNRGSHPNGDGWQQIHSELDKIIEYGKIISDYDRKTRAFTDNNLNISSIMTYAKYLGFVNSLNLYKKRLFNNKRFNNSVPVAWDDFDRYMNKNKQNKSLFRRLPTGNSSINYAGQNFINDYC
jgi:hypothetical protein